MKVKKERKKDQTSNCNMRKSVLILTMLICIIIAMITYWIYAYYHKYGTLYLENKLISYKVDDYIETKGNIVNLKNIDENIINDFLKKQETIINNKGVISTDITKGIYQNILSVKIVYTILTDKDNSEDILTLNIDLKNNKLLTNEELLDMTNSSYKSIATSIFNEYIKLSSDSDILVTDAITGSKLSSARFNEDSEKYIIRIREKLPDIMNLYLQDSKIYYIVELSEIDKVCYTREENNFVYIEKEIGKI